MLALGKKNKKKGQQPGLHQAEPAAAWSSDLGLGFFTQAVT